MAGNQPLFAQEGRSSATSDERAAREDDALLGSQRGSSDEDKVEPRSRAGFWREVGIFVWALLATATVIVLAVVLQHQSKSPTPGGKFKEPTGKKNLIFMVSDGMGPASLSLTRSFRQYQNNLPIDDVLILDQHFIDHTACGTVLEAAKRAGYMTGLVVTTSITDATPACFASHVNLRSEEDLIAQQEVGHSNPLGRTLDLMFGGGRCHFLPNTMNGSCRGDDLDVTKVAQEEYGWTYIDNRDDFNNLGPSPKLPLMGLFARYNIPYEIDRRTMDEEYPSLEEMARVALRALEAATQDSDKGFFLMIEGSRIDHAAHGNDPAAQVHEVLAYDRTVAAVLEFLDRSDDDGAFVGTSDHETGGLSIARQLHPPPSYPHYGWNPAVLANASHSAEHLARMLNDDWFEADKRKSYINKKYLQDGLGIWDAADEELDLLIDNPTFAVYYFADMISRRARIGWSTHGHSAVDVNIYGHGEIGGLKGNHENTDVGKFLREFLDVNVDTITKKLNKKSKPISSASDNGLSWTGKVPVEEDFRALSKQHEDFTVDFPQGS
ncbi:Farnesyl diphosphatase [Hyphodiscus hymeniophilus]|uniref:alkaline phosphatase n=1 Tax=Hyphodiscus hymeniophilus TaxID=353542 RepID=A0A9P6VJ76_9HELO|nr:Farnesyl diphosphatase [Hyphodiscus hymeniophilus]